MHWVIGAGAVGIGLGASLLAAGERVGFVARGGTAEALAREGCARTGLFGDVAFGPEDFALCASPSEIAGPVTSVWVATKTGANPELAAALAETPCLRDESEAPLVVAQNGLGNAEQFAARIERRRVFNASVITGFRRTAPSRVEVTVHADRVLLGSLFGAGEDPVRPLALALTRGGLPAGTTPDLGAVLWGKLLYNCALNPLGALLRVPYGELGRRDATRALMEGVVREIYEVMEADGAHTSWPDPEAYLTHFYGTLLPPTEEHESSMLQDVRAGRRTEVDALCGEVARRGERHGIATPLNQALTRLVRAMEERETG